MKTSHFITIVTKRLTVTLVSFIHCKMQLPFAAKRDGLIWRSVEGVCCRQLGKAMRRASPLARDTHPLPPCLSTGMVPARVLQI